jgi:hypothetical protein
METEPSKKEARRRYSAGPPEAIKTDANVANPATDGKSGPFVDFWQEARINYLAPEVIRLKAGPVARRFLREAKSCYIQFRRCGCPRLLYLCWSALDIVAGQLVGRAACSAEQLPSQGFSTTEGKSDPKYGFR